MTPLTDQADTLRAQRGAREESLRRFTALNEATPLPSFEPTSPLPSPEGPPFATNTPHASQYATSNDDAPRENPTDPATEAALSYEQTDNHGQVRDDGALDAAAVRVVVREKLADYRIVAGAFENFARWRNFHETMLKN